MKKPNNYEATPASGDYVPVALGGHLLIIKEVAEMQSRTGKDMIKVSFDFASGDAQPAYFSNVFRDDVRPDKKWPAAGTTYLLTEDADGNCSRQFKTFITSVEKSNLGFRVDWGEGFTRGFQNKLTGGVFGIVEEEYNDKVHKNRKLRWFRSTEGVLEAPVPEEKLLANGSRSRLPEDKDGFISVPEGCQEELPF